MLQGIGESTPFHCQRCGACCRLKGGIVRLSDQNIREIASYLGMSEADFIAHETVLAPDRTGLILKDRPDGACAYLTDANECRIYSVRPTNCRTFPQLWTNADTSYCPALSAPPSSVSLPTT